ncbi:MAG: dihydrofolate reductase family protein [Nocardioidaceae bacterium]
MGKVVTHMTMSLDGFIADPQDGIVELFGWYDAGPVLLPTADEQMSFHVDEQSAGVLRELLSTAGALVSGRRLFDLTRGWGDNHPLGVPVVVVTHHVPDDAAVWKRTSFADDVASGVARAQEIAGDKTVIVSSANISRQALELGLVDEVHVSLVPVLMGSGIPYFADLATPPYHFEDPVVVEGTRATHLRFAVRRE